MHGKTVLITGANSGLGFATAIALAPMGARFLLPAERCTWSAA